MRRNLGLKVRLASVQTMSRGEYILRDSWGEDDKNNECLCEHHNDQSRPHTSGNAKGSLYYYVEEETDQTTYLRLLASVPWRTSPV